MGVQRDHWQCASRKSKMGTTQEWCVQFWANIGSSSSLNSNYMVTGWKNMTCALLKKQGLQFMDTLNLADHKIHSSDLCWQWIPFRGPSKRNEWFWQMARLGQREGERFQGIRTFKITWGYIYIYILEDIYIYPQ